MKKFLITILAALLAGGIVSAQSFPDIPGGHWAGDAVEEIADLGIVIGFPDGTFRGNEAFTRYQSALVVSRLLDVIDANMEAELGSLRGALQELAGDVAAQGVRLAAAESAIAGISDDVAAGAADLAAFGDRLDDIESANAMTADDVATNAQGIASNAQGIAANAARLDALEAAMADMPEGMDEAVLRDLQNQIASQRVAIDTAQAQAEAAEERADGAYDLALQALAASDANASDIAALNQAFQLLSDRVDAMGTAAPAPAPEAAPVDLSGIARNAGDIANIREFVILLRRDQVALRDRVSALEAADEELAASVSDLEARVTALETNPLGFSGSIELEYYVGRTLGTFAFDVDRVYGANAPRSMGNSYFSTGTADLDGDDTAGNDVGERAQDRQDITQESGDLSTTLNLNVGSGNVFEGAGSPRALNRFDAVITVEIEQGFIADDSTFTTGFDAWLFTITDFTTTFDFIGAEPIVFAFGEEVSVEFTEYVFDINDQVGFVATISAPDFLSFLNPGLTAAYFSDTADGVMRGIRGTMAPEFGDAIGLQGGVSFAQYALNTADKDDVAADNTVTTVWGADGMVDLLGIVGLDFEYANSSTDGTPNGSILYVVAEVDGDNLPILNSLGANYRDMDAGFDGIGGAGDDPFELGQTGFGVEAGLGLFILDVTGFFDSYTHELSGDDNVGFGVEVAADLFAGFALTGFYESASVNGTIVDSTVNVADVEGYDLLDGNYETAFGVGIEHDGDAANALISGLNIAAGYERHTADYSETVIYANADYALDISIVSLTPYVGYRSVVDSDAGTNDYNEIVAGTGLRTAALDIFLRPSLQAAANYRSTTWSDAQDFTATELQWSVGLNLEEFLLANSELSARVGSWTGTNTNLTTNTVGAGDGATDISAGRDGDANTGTTENVFGYEVVWDYYDLVMAYGSYTSDRGGASASAQAFSIKYTVDF